MTGPLRYHDLDGFQRDVLWAVLREGAVGDPDYVSGASIPAVTDQLHELGYGNPDDMVVFDYAQSLIDRGWLVEARDGVVLSHDGWDALRSRLRGLEDAVNNLPADLDGEGPRLRWEQFESPVDDEEVPVDV